MVSKLSHKLYTHHAIWDNIILHQQEEQIESPLKFLGVAVRVLDRLAINSCRNLNQML